MKTVIREECLKHCQFLLESELYVLFVEAKAGQGKTVLARQFIDRVGCPWVWHTCDISDADPVHFLEGIVQELQRQLQCFSSQIFFQTLSQKGPPEILLRLALTSLTETLAMCLVAPVLIVLDDAHLLESSNASLSLLRDMVDSMPRDVRFIILTRRPLSLQGERIIPSKCSLTIDNDLLAFKKAEISTLFNVVLGIPRSTSAVSRLHDATDGWVAGLLLLRFESEENSVFLRDQNIENLDPYFLRYCFGDVAGNLRYEILLLSLLQEMPWGLLSENNSADALKWLETMAAQNLFTRVETVDGQKVIRFHHLFQGFLQRLAEKSCALGDRQSIRRSAGEWRLGGGEVAAALTDFAQAEDWKRLEEVIRAHGQDLLVHNRHSTLQRVIDLIPCELVNANGWFCYFKGSIQVAHAEVGAEDTLRRAISIFNCHDDELGELLTLGALLYFHLSYDITYGKKRRLVHRAGALFNALAESLDPMTSMHLTQALATTCLYYLADYPTADKYLKIAQQIQRSIGTPTSYMELAIASLLSHGMRGNIQAAINEMDMLYHHANYSGANPLSKFFMQIIQANYLEMQGLEDNYRESKAHLQAQFSNELEQSHLGPFLHVWDMDMLMAQGRYAGALNLAERVLGNPAYADNSHLVSQFLHYQALALAYLGREDEVLPVVRKSLRVRANAGGRYFVTLNHAMLGGALSLGKHTQTAERILTRVIRESHAIGEHYAGATALAYRAALRLRLGQGAEAKADTQAMFDTMRIYGNRHFFGWTPHLMKSVLGFASAQGIHPGTARMLAQKRLGTCILPDCQCIPVLRVSTFFGTELILDGKEEVLLPQDFTPLQAKTLGLLAMAPSYSRSLEQIQQELWPSQSEESCRSKLDTMLSRLRKVLSDTFGPEFTKMYLVVRAGTVSLHHCSSDVADAMNEAQEGLRLSALSRHFQAHCAFVRMSVVLGATPGGGLCRPGLVLPTHLMPTIMEAAVQWVKILKIGARFQDALVVAQHALSLDPINDRLQRMRYNLLTILKRPAEAGAALRDYRRCLTEEGFSESEIEEIVDVLLTE